MPALEKMQQLQSLDLSDNSLGEAGLMAFVPALEKMQQLQSLYLRGNSLGEAGARALAPALEKMQQLRILDLGYRLFDGTKSHGQRVSRVADSLTMSERMLRQNFDESIGMISTALKRR